MSERMTDAQVRAELERIDPLYPSLFGMTKRYFSEADRKVWTDIFRLLAESLAALRKIAGSEASMYYSKAMAQPCRICMHLIKIARNACKGGE